MALRHMQIGEVAELTGLSLRTIRYYEEVGLVTPSARSQGGFRLYTDSEVTRLELIKRMKPLDFSLDEMRDLIQLLDGLRTEMPAPRREETLDRVGMYLLAVEERCKSLRSQLEVAEGFAASLRRETRPRRQTEHSP